MVWGYGFGPESRFDYQRKAGGRTPVSCKLMSARAAEQSDVNPIVPTKVDKACNFGCKPLFLYCFFAVRMAVFLHLFGGFEA